MPGKSSRRWTPVVLLLGLLVYLPGSGRPLRDAEAKYAEIPREMLELGTGISPFLNYVAYPAKPPLTFWVSMAAYRIFGVSQRVARVVTILWALLIGLLVAVLADEMFGPAHGPPAAALWFLTLGVYLYCLDVGIELGLVACQVAAVLCFWRVQRTHTLAPLFGFHAAMALGFLAKGLPGVVIPAGVALVFLAANRRPREIRRLLHPAALATGLAVAVSWIALNVWRTPGFLGIFFGEEHLWRFLGAMTSNDDVLPTGVWLGQVAGEFFPWIVYAPLVGLGAWRLARPTEDRGDTVTVLVLWAALPLLLYGVSRSKGDYYGLQVYPPMVVLFAPFVRALLDGRSQFSPRAWAAPWLLVTVAAAGIALWLGSAGGREAHATAPWMLGVVATVAVLAATAGGSLLWGRVYLAAFLVVALTLVLFAALHQRTVAAFPVNSMKFAADHFNTVTDPGAVLVTDERPDEYEHVAILPFYTHRPAYLLKNEGASILHFTDAAREAQCLDNDGLIKVVRERTVYLVGNADVMPPRLAALGLSATQVRRSGDRALFRLGSR
jgi:4-amino-4-deoxy-L-arabinose transferase-like glycosyltransferase